MDMVSSVVAEKPVVIFSKSSCSGMSHSVKSLICSFGANPTVYELGGLPNGQQIETALLQQGCQQLPAVFIGQKFIGGAKEVMSLNLRNELVPLLKRAGAIWL
ncbi:Monothiol glutaredoxin-S2 [Morella rubra]|uniref:Monothiol glutaredoxin-S2 n=1 Tax=Morella rubra TaxID=262757 RepID=A0A6A1URE9_9ROSI|nr:Monothiol glutaredoxin-S2 [Morella rubra]